MKYFAYFSGCMLTVILLASPELFAGGCRLNSDCPVGQICPNGSCVLDPVCATPEANCLRCPSAACTGIDVCAYDSGSYICLPPNCVNDLDCPLGDICNGWDCVIDVTADRDRDGVPDAVDSCPTTTNTDQRDLDGDDQGDVCDLDDDGDGVPDTSDNCARIPNTNQLDIDNNSVGNACERPQLIISTICSTLYTTGLDTDNDGITDDCDKCRYLASATNFDSDGDGFGDVCDPDKDGDTLRNVDDNCPGMPNLDQADCNCNGMGDVCDALPCDATFCGSL